MGVEVEIVAGSYEQISFGYRVSRDGEVPYVFTCLLVVCECI